MDTLTTYTHRYELQVITALLLISTLYKSLHIKCSQSAFTSRCSVAALNNGYSSAMFSLDVSWRRILTMEILQLPWLRLCPLVSAPRLNSQLTYKVKVILPLAVYRQTICLGMKPHETHDQRFFYQLNPLR
jgi:hypothetical protein